MFTEFFTELQAGLRNATAEKLLQKARANTLSPDFSDWSIADDDGWTVAHEAAAHGHLPRNFHQWELADCNGLTVAHLAAFHGHLPEGFDLWKIAMRDGWTVAHEAAEHGHLPAAFDQWQLMDGDGVTVADIVLHDTAYEHSPLRASARNFIHNPARLACPAISC